MSSVTVAKAMRVLRERGVGGLAQAAQKQLLGVMRAYCGLTRQLHFVSNADLLDFGCTLGGGIIRPFQARSEILALLDEVHKLNPRRVLEVGTANGGTLFLLSQVSHPDATIISIDLPGGKFGEGYAIWRAPLYRRFARGRQTIRLMRCDSHSAKTSMRVRKALGDYQLDVAFIDGDHSYEGVKRDFELYSPLVRKGGMVAFHDIAPPSDPAIQVRRFWHEVKHAYRHLELLSGSDQRGYGIGILYMS